MTPSRLLAIALLLCALSDDLVRSVRIYKSRRNAMKMLSGATIDTQQYFGSCEQSASLDVEVGSCVLAIDNEFSQEWSQCAVSWYNTFWSALWRGDLENPVYITSVYILNADWKGVDNKDGLLEFTISGAGQVCYTHKSEKSFNSKTFPCDIMASEIVIKTNLPNAVLALCDVQVFGVALKFPTIQTRPRRLSYDHCEQSNTYKSMHCWFATDGWTVQKANEGFCAMIDKSAHSWWKGILAIPAIVQQVEVFNRVDCCMEELTRITIFVSGNVCAEYNSATTFESKTFECNVFGDEVKIIQRNFQHKLTLCEVRVYGHVLEMLDEQKRTPVGCAVDKPDDPDMAEFNNKGPVSLTTMHTGKCDRICRRLKAKFFGLQAGSECWCGNSFGKHGTVNVSECMVMMCEGKRTELCGGVDRKGVYQLN